MRLVKDMYEDVKTMVRRSVGETQEFTVKVGLHQEFTVKVGLHQETALSPYLFHLILDVIVENVKKSPGVFCLQMTLSCVENIAKKWRS